MAERDCHWRKMVAQHQARKDEDALARPVVAERIRSLRAAGRRRDLLWLVLVLALLLAVPSERARVQAEWSERAARYQRLAEGWQEAQHYAASRACSAEEFANRYAAELMRYRLRDLNDGGSDAHQER